MALSRPSKIALWLIPINTAIWGTAVALIDKADWLFLVFFAASIVQVVYCVKALLAGFRKRGSEESPTGDLVVGGVLGLASIVFGSLGTLVFGLAGVGGAWGRPLRVRGKQLHPSLKEGANWTSGPRPDASHLDLATRRALEALWLHDAQKEHASVPAFSRVSWLLAAAGAPAELLIGCHKAATEEIEHTQACFALAAGYGGRSFTVEPMPDLLLGGLDGSVDPRVTLAIESLSDGCQLEDFNADVAATCAKACEEPVTRAVLHKIAIEERTHAELSWAILEWAVQHHRAVVEAPLADALVALDRYPRPTAVSAEKASIVALADVAELRRHGRLQDVEWQAAWDARLVATKARFAALLVDRRAA